MMLSELLGSPVVTESGTRLGELRDLRVREEPGTVVCAIVVDEHGVLPRLVAGRSADGRVGTHPTIAWEKVRALKPGQILVADDHGLST
jgi:sporulation protein YlmC with PRC-barrel domain